MSRKKHKLKFPQYFYAVRREMRCSRLRRLDLSLVDMETVSSTGTICDCGRVSRHYKTRLEDGRDMCPYLLLIKLQRLTLNGMRPKINFDVLSQL